MGLTDNGLMGLLSGKGGFKPMGFAQMLMDNGGSGMGAMGLMNGQKDKAPATEDEILRMALENPDMRTRLLQAMMKNGA